MIKGFHPYYYPHLKGDKKTIETEPQLCSNVVTIQHKQKEELLCLF